MWVWVYSVRVCVHKLGSVVCVVPVHLHAHMLCEDAPSCVVPHEFCEKRCMIDDRLFPHSPCTLPCCRTTGCLFAAPQSRVDV